MRLSDLTPEQLDNVEQNIHRWATDALDALDRLQPDDAPPDHAYVDKVGHHGDRCFWCGLTLAEHPMGAWNALGRIEEGGGGV